MKRKNKRRILIFKEYVIPCAIFAAITFFCIIGIQAAERKQREEALSIAEESILRGVVSCYALEGFYPPDYNYLKEHYGIRIDEEKYTVFYSAFASNLMPDITVVEK